LDSIQSEFNVLDGENVIDEDGVIKDFPCDVEEIDLEAILSDEYLIFDSDSESKTNINHLEDKLTTWALKENVTHSALNKLL